MATLRFNGTNSYLGGTGSGPMNGPITLAFLLKRGSIGTYQTLINARDASDNTGAWLDIKNIDNLRYSFSESAQALSDTTNWWLICMTWTTGGTKPRYHFKNITTGSTWIHQDGTSTIAAPRVTNKVTIGIVTPGSEPLDADMALVAWWDGTALTDPQVESLATNKKSLDWMALNPSSLTELVSATPTDAKGLVTWTPTNVALTGMDPTGWTFGTADDGNTPISATLQYVGARSGITRYLAPFDVTAAYSPARYFDLATGGSVVLTRGTGAGTQLDLWKADGTYVDGGMTRPYTINGLSAGRYIVTASDPAIQLTVTPSGGATFVEGATFVDHTKLILRVTETGVVSLVSPDERMASVIVTENVNPRPQIDEVPARPKAEITEKLNLLMTVTEQALSPTVLEPASVTLAVSVDERQYSVDVDEGR